jgi:hypothetical protein
MFPQSRPVMKKVVLLMPYYGQWPEWFNLFIETCKWNPTIDWIFFTDLEKPRNRCPNVHYVRISLPELLELASSRVGFKIHFTDPYKLCDLRPGFGVIFHDYIRKADYFGWGDIDVMYGDIRKFVADEVLRYDVISFHAHQLSNHFCLFRNVDSVKEKYKMNEVWKEKVNLPQAQCLDDRLTLAFDVRSNYFFESYNTPNITDRPPWKDGTFDFPKEWRWKEGRLTTDKTGSEEFPYFHFMVWKGGLWGKRHGGGQWEKLSKLVHFDDRDLSHGWKINEQGFWLLNGKGQGRRLIQPDSVPIVSQPC